MGTYKDVRARPPRGRASARGYMARRPAFTIVELLVTLAILAILAAVLLPIVSSTRAMALRVVCTSRLKDLAFACNLHRTEKGAYPVQPGATFNSTVNAPAGPLEKALPPLGSLLPPPKPTDMEPAFLNVLQPYLRFPRVDDKAAAGDLPHAVQSPTVEDADDAGRQSVVEFTFSKPSFYTGYAYCVRPKDQPAFPTVKLLKPKRVPGPREDSRVVIWADDVQWSVQDQAWGFSHAEPSARPGPRPLTYFEPKGLLGQHRAFTDGSVEWVNGAELDLDIKGRSDRASDLASLSVSNLHFFWF